MKLIIAGIICSVLLGIVALSASLAGAEWATGIMWALLGTMITTGVIAAVYGMRMEETHDN